MKAKPDDAQTVSAGIVVPIHKNKQYLDIKMLRAYGNTPATAKLSITAKNRLAHLVGFVVGSQKTLKLLKIR